MSEKEKVPSEGEEDISGDAVLRITCYDDDDRSEIQILARKSDRQSRHAYFLAQLATQGLRQETPPELRISLFNLMLKRLSEQEKEILKEEIVCLKDALRKFGYAD